jgi:hypothetical protein
MMAPEYNYNVEPEKNSIPSKNSRCFDFCFPKRFCHCCCCSIQVGLIQSQVFFLLCGIFSIVIGYLHTANMVMGSIMIVLAVMAVFATVWKSWILAPLGITIAVIGIVNTVSTTNLSLEYDFLKKLLFYLLSVDHFQSSKYSGLLIAPT